MSLLTEAVAQEQQRIKRMISQYETELSCLPKGVLITKSIKGNQYFYLQYRNGKYNGEPMILFLALSQTIQFTGHLLPM